MHYAPVRSNNQPAQQFKSIYKEEIVARWATKRWKVPQMGSDRIEEYGQTHRSERNVWSEAKVMQKFATEIEQVRTEQGSGCVGEFKDFFFLPHSVA